ncbi:unnamed protein product [Ectocarpus sp. 8 AP-2014]
MKIRRVPLYATQRVKTNPQHLCWKQKKLRAVQTGPSVWTKNKRRKHKFWCISPLVACVILGLWFVEARPIYHGSIARARDCLLFFFLASILFSSCFSGEGCNGDPPGTHLLMTLFKAF